MIFTNNDLRKSKTKLKFCHLAVLGISRYKISRVQILSLSQRPARIKTTEKTDWSSLVVTNGFNDGFKLFTRIVLFLLAFKRFHSWIFINNFKAYQKRNSFAYNFSVVYFNYCILYIESCIVFVKWEWDDFLRFANSYRNILYSATSGQPSLESKFIWYILTILYSE